MCLFVGTSYRYDIDQYVLEEEVITSFLSKDNELRISAQKIITWFRENKKTDKEIIMLLKSALFFKEDNEILNIYHNIFEKDSLIIKKLYKYIYECL